MIVKKQLACDNPDYAGKDLYDTLAKGTPVEYGLFVQLMNPQDESSLAFDPLDDTQVWDVRQYPLLPVGKMVLNRNPENYKEQVEKLAFSPANLLERAELTDDRILQGHAKIYWDSQPYHLGPDFRKIPIKTGRQNLKLQVVLAATWQGDLFAPIHQKRMISHRQANFIAR